MIDSRVGIEELDKVRPLKDFLEGEIPEEHLKKVEDGRYTVKRCEHAEDESLGIRDSERGFAATFYDDIEELTDDLEDYEPELKGRYFDYGSDGSRTICDLRNPNAWITSDQAYDLSF